MPIDIYLYLHMLLLSGMRRAYRSGMHYDPAVNYAEFDDVWRPLLLAEHNRVMDTIETKG